MSTRTYAYPPISSTTLSAFPYKVPIIDYDIGALISEGFRAYMLRPGDGGQTAELNGGGFYVLPASESEIYTA